MKSKKKITIILPSDLIERALKASHKNLTATVKQGLEIVAASEAYERLAKLRGKFPKLKINLDELRKDRDE